MLHVMLRLWYCSTRPPTDVEKNEAVPELTSRVDVAPWMLVRAALLLEVPPAAVPFVLPLVVVAVAAEPLATFTAQVMASGGRPGPSQVRLGAQAEPRGVDL